MIKNLEKLKNNNINPEQLFIEIDGNVRMGCSEKSLFLEYEKYIVNLYLSIPNEDENDEECDDEELVGKIICIYLKKYKSFDEYCMEFEKVDAWEYKSNISNEFINNNDDNINILYISRFYIAPKYRNKGLGQLYFSLVLNTLGKKAKIITIAPVQENDKGERFNEEAAQFELCTKMMISFLKEFGFVQLIDNENM